MTVRFGDHLMRLIGWGALQLQTVRTPGRRKSGHLLRRVAQSNSLPALVLAKRRCRRSDNPDGSDFAEVLEAVPLDWIRESAR
jgi:hypothetical protein